MEANSGFSVALHVKGVPPSGRSPENSVYVSTTDDPLVAAKFLRGEKGYVYKIRAVPRMFSVAGTLQKYYDYPFPVSNQREWVAMGGVSWDQIESAAFIKPTDSGVVAPDTKFNWKANRAFAS
ncbi:hypothetical protein HIM_07918 [Hirsutella minnesotensis 3608]|uniref:Uncharacterized protein n=1 Tax=Hirsutella minnesotensis 3608 TaxID=1043627 RepID=A0A0F7ZHJ0_9HYPO|nr:hypothetical protein HIM_07918 [Hirsutella minnesotensis 3608]